MNFNNSKYDSIRNSSPTKEQLIIKGIQQAWNRRFLSNIHSGVRVKIQQQKNKNSSLIEPIHKDIHYQSLPSSFKQTNPIESMLKRLWIESETSTLSQNGRKSLEKFQHSSLTSDQMKSILNNNLFTKKNSLGINYKNISMNSIGIQTNIIKRIDQQTSCNILRLRKTFSKKNRSSSSSTVSISKTSVSDDNSTYTNSTSIETSTITSSSTPIFCSITNRNDNKPESSSVGSSDSETKSIKDDPVEIHKIIQHQNEIIREGVEQLMRYQKLCESYKLTSNKAVRQFLMKSTVLSPESLYKLSIINEPNSTHQIKRKTK
ncbi:unnamed protein product [Rotaria sp. Silwood1]|nr:unnamed protein product [Rotaria sp. Silwood1]